MTMQPRLLTISAGTPWNRVYGLTIQKSAYAEPQDHTLATAAPYLFVQPNFSIYDTLRPYQRGLLRNLVEKEKLSRGLAPGNVELHRGEMQQLVAQIREPHFAGLLTVAGEGALDFSQVMLRLGVFWFYELARLKAPCIDADAVESFGKRVHENPEEVFFRTGFITDPLKKSQRTLFLNRWIALRRKFESAFCFRLNGLSHCYDHADLSHLDLARMVASKASLKQAGLWGTDLTAADFSSSLLDGVTAVGADFLRADLGEVRARNSDFRYCFFNDVKAKGADFRDADFTGAILHRIHLHGATMDGAKLGSPDSKNKIRMKVLCGRHKERLALFTTDAVVEKSTSWDQTKIFNAVFEFSSFDHSQFKGTEFTDVRFEACSFVETQFHHCVFSGEVVFTDCDFIDTKNFLALAQSKLKGTVTLLRPKNLTGKNKKILEDAGFVVIC